MRNQSRNRLAFLLLVAFVPAWYLVMEAMTGHKPLTFKLFATGHLVTVDGGQLTLITAGLNAVTIIVGFTIFAAIRRTLAFDRRLVFAAVGLVVFRIRTRSRVRPRCPVERNRPAWRFRAGRDFTTRLRRPGGRDTDAPGQALGIVGSQRGHVSGPQRRRLGRGPKGPE